MNAATRSSDDGRGNGQLKGNRRIVAKVTPTSNLLLALAHVGGAEI
jgi:hypothetical protein